MTPDESLEAQQRMQALMLADRRCKEDATADQVLAEAEKVLAFLKAGIKVAG